jgi:glycosyltransferase involved in cell wall biosynthesis
MSGNPIIELLIRSTRHTPPRHRIAALVESPDHVCHRYRVSQFVSALTAAGGSLETRVLPGGTWARTAAILSTRRHDAVLLQRRLLSRAPLALLRRCTRRLIFDFDDAVFHRDSYHPAGIMSAERERRFAATMRCADVVLAGNRYLAECAIERGAAPERVKLIPTCLDPERYTVASHAAQSKRPDLVWIGSASTLRGLKRTEGLWSELGRSIPGLRLNLICDRAASFDGLDTSFTPWSERTEARELAAGDVGISWMPDDGWSRGKCGLKVLQYQAAGLPVIANRVGIHTELVEHGRTGFLADTAGEWIDAVRALADPDLRARMGRAGREAVTRRFSVSSWSARFVSHVLAGPDVAALEVFL